MSDSEEFDEIFNELREELRTAPATRLPESELEALFDPRECDEERLRVSRATIADRDVRDAAIRRMILDDACSNARPPEAIRPETSADGLQAMQPRRPSLTATSLLAAAAAILAWLLWWLPGSAEIDASKMSIQVADAEVVKNGTGPAFFFASRDTRMLITSEQGQLDAHTQLQWVAYDLGARRSSTQAAQLREGVLLADLVPTGYSGVLLLAVSPHAAPEIAVRLQELGTSRVLEAAPQGAAAVARQLRSELANLPLPSGTVMCVVEVR